MDQNSSFQSPDENISFERLLEQLVDLMQYTVDNADKPIKKPLPEDFLSRLDQIEKQVELFCQFNKAFIDNIQESNLMGDEADPSAEIYTKSEKRILERAEQLKKEAQIKFDALRQRELDAIARGQGPEKQSSKKKDETKERKKKFKRTGFDTKWKPM